MARTKLIPAITANLDWPEAVRALLCMLPMLVAVGIGQMTYVVALGQGGFFFSSLLLPRRNSGRLLMGSILIALGMGFYLMGGTVAPLPVVAVIFTFFAALNLSFLTSWSIGGPIALSIVVIYTAGLNTGSPEKAAANFLAFGLVMAWAKLGPLANEAASTCASCSSASGGQSRLRKPQRSASTPSIARPV